MEGVQADLLPACTDLRQHFSNLLAICVGAGKELGIAYTKTNTQMDQIPASALKRYLFGGRLSRIGCLMNQRRPVLARPRISHAIRALQTDTDHAQPSPAIPLRKQLKDEAKQRKAELHKSAKKKKGALENWELTVGIEIHAQLNTARKLFSAASSSVDDAPNTHVAFFDIAIPGSQPIFQKEALIPAIRAALALNCNIQKKSKFDRKHYFHWDQPSGYQITQYYEPFAKDGFITLYPHDGIAKEDGGEVRIDIKQIQMEQDTAKTTTMLGGIHLLDFNRAGLPLIEIITQPQIHHPQTAAALVRKIQLLLNSVDACVLGMQSGGLRADVNVSVRRRGDVTGSLQYGSVSGLGQRTEIKNLSSFKAVEDAIIAERDRQITLIESGGVVEGETRGWTIGNTETVRLRGKEGEVDYRYMPDPDIAPVIIGEDLLGHLQSTLGILPEEEIGLLVSDYGLTAKDAKSLVSLNDGYRVEYFRNIVDHLIKLTPPEESKESAQVEVEPSSDLSRRSTSLSQKRLGKLAGNWVLHELGGVVSAEEESKLEITTEGECRQIPSLQLATLVNHVDTKRVTGKTAKRILATLFDNAAEATYLSVDEIIASQDLWFKPLSESEYFDLAHQVYDEKIVEEILNGKEGKINYLVGQMIRSVDDGRVDPVEATRIMKEVIAQRRRASIK